MEYKKLLLNFKPEDGRKLDIYKLYRAISEPAGRKKMTRAYSTDGWRMIRFQSTVEQNLFVEIISKNNKIEIFGRMIPKAHISYETHSQLFTAIEEKLYPFMENWNYNQSIIK